MIITWLGHASFKIETSDSKTIYIDPYEGEYTTPADLILITHSHFDHSDQVKISRVREENTAVVTSLENSSNITGSEFLEEDEEREFSGIKVKGVAAYNVNKFRSKNEPFHPKGFGLGYIAEIDGKQIYHAGDSDYVPEMRSLKNIDLALLPIGGTYTMTAKEAISAVKSFKPKIVIPMHYTSKSFGGPIELPQDPEAFKREIESTCDIKVILLKPGDEYKL